jgi:carbonic anhydrase
VSFPDYTDVMLLLTVNRIEESIREDLALIRASPLIKKTTQIVGLKYDISTGVLSQVEEIKSEL